MPARGGTPPPAATTASGPPPLQAKTAIADPFWFAEGGRAPVQRKVTVADAGPDLAAAATAPAGDGRALPDDLRARMEASFETSFADVRLFQGERADAMGARAFAQGSELHFAPGEYDPASTAGQALIGHELAHVVQQRSGRVRGEQGFGGLINADLTLEHEADVAGERAARGEPAGLIGGGEGGASGSIQRAIRIGKNQQSPTFIDWKGFEAKIPVPFQAGLTRHKVAIEKLLSDEGEPHTYTSFKELLDRLEGKEEIKEEKGGSSKVGSTCKKLDLEGAVGLLKRERIILCDPSDAVVGVGNALGKGAFLVICIDSPFDGTWLDELAPHCERIVIVGADMMTFVTLWLAARHQIDARPKCGVVDDWVVDDEYVIGQSPQMRGDMHDVLPALALDRRLKVALCVTDPWGYNDADIILGYYSGFRGRVTVCPFAIGTLSPLKGKLKKIGEATEVLVQAVQRDPVRARKTITDQTTGSPTEEDNQVYKEMCQVLNFQPGTPYLIINYRDSGHKPGKNREPSHPELDTGTDGMTQLCQAAIALGFIPVPMGMPPGMTKSNTKPPHLVEYWSFPCCVATEQRNKRQAEYGLLRYLAEHFDIRALAMRSGGTDAMVYAGIETISLDLASSGKTDEELDRANLDGQYKEGGNRSWMRAAVRDLIMPGKFHQGFFEEPRPDDKDKKESKKEKEKDKKEDKGEWRGGFSERDVGGIKKTIHFFFGTGDDPLHGLLELAPNSPLADPETFAKKIEQRRSKEDARKFLVYVREMNEAREKLRASMLRDLPLEVLRLELEICRLELELVRIQVEKMQLLFRLDALRVMQLLRGNRDDEDRVDL